MDNSKDKKDIKKISDEDTETVAGGRDEDGPMLICHFCGKKFPMDNIVMCSFGACCAKCSRKKKK